VFNAIQLFNQSRSRQFLAEITLESYVASQLPGSQIAAGIIRLISSAHNVNVNVSKGKNGHYLIVFEGAHGRSRLH